MCFISTEWEELQKMDRLSTEENGEIHIQDPGKVPPPPTTTTTNATQSEDFHQRKFIYFFDNYDSGNFIYEKL